MVDFRSRKKKTLPVALPDGAELALKTPSKALFAISPADIEGLLDIDDIAYLIREYSKFVKGVISDPN